MLVTIQLGRRIRIDIRADRDLLNRVSALETEVDKLREDFRMLNDGLREYALAEDLVDAELLYEYFSEADEIRSRIASIDFWKADRNHSHKGD